MLLVDMLSYIFKERRDMKEQQSIEWKSVEQRYADLDIQAKENDRRLVDKKGVVVLEYKMKPVEIKAV